MHMLPKNLKKAISYHHTRAQTFYNAFLRPKTFHQE